MSCQQCREVVSASLDGEASADERSAADAHLADCPECRAYEAAATRLGRLARLRSAQPVPDLAGSVLAALGIAEPAEGLAGSAAADADTRPAPPELRCLQGGCCGDAPGDESAVRSACGCVSTCGCGCQDGARCRCGAKVA